MGSMEILAGKRRKKTDPIIIWVSEYTDSRNITRMPSRNLVKIKFRYIEFFSSLFNSDEEKLWLQKGQEKVFIGIAV